MLNDVPIYYEIWRQLNGFPPDYIDHDDLTIHKEDKKTGHQKD